jgi:hypothetical protein
MSVVRCDDSEKVVSVVRYDHGTLPGKAEITPEGFLRVDAPITRLGVLPYTDYDGTPRGELRHPDDWSDFASLASKPITNDHPPPRKKDGKPLVDAKNAKALAIGWTGDVRADGAFLRTLLTIMDSDGVAAVQRGRRGTSTGVEVDLVPERSEYEGVPYEYRQKNPRLNHIAIVDSPRAGTMIRLDGNQQVEDAEGETNMVKVTLDGISYEAAPEVANALTKAQLAATELKAALDTASAKGQDEAEKIKAERDTYKERLDAAEKRDIRGEVRARVGLETAARSILPEAEHVKLDEMDDAAIRKAVVAATWPNLKLDEKADAYIAQRFEIALEERAGKVATYQQHVDALAKQRQTVVPRQDSAGDPSSEAIRRANERINNQWKPKAA